MNSKTFLNSLVIAAFIGLLAACGGADTTNTSADKVEKVVKEITVNSADELAQTADIGIGGMTCELGCAKSIEQNLKAMAGVSTCVVDFENQVAHVTYDGKAANEDDMVKFINEFHDGTYKVTSIEVTKPVLKSAGKKDDDSANSASDNGVSVSHGISFPNIFDAFIHLAQP